MNHFNYFSNILFIFLLLQLLWENTGEFQTVDYNLSNRSQELSFEVKIKTLD